MEEHDEHVNPEKLPIYLKGREIYDLTQKIVDLIPENAEPPLREYKGWMLEDAAYLSVKIAGAEGGELYDIKMECAAIIRKAARDLIVHCRGLETYGYEETQYLDLIRDAIEEYRILFIDWVNTFDQWNYVVDRWGLFNPPGVGPYDHDPDEDLPPS